MRRRFCSCLAAYEDKGEKSNVGACDGDDGDSVIRDGWRRRVGYLGRLLEIVQETADVNRDQECLSADDNFIGDLGADSLDTIELAMSFEDEFYNTKRPVGQDH
jgi:acyl carrier protein